MNIYIDNTISKFGDNDVFVFNSNEIVVMKMLGHNLFYVGIKDKNFYFEDIRCYDYCIDYDNNLNEIISIEKTTWGNDKQNCFLDCEVGYDESINEIEFAITTLIGYEQYFLKDMTS